MKRIILIIFMLFLVTGTFYSAIAEESSNTKSITGKVMDKSGLLADQTVFLRVHDMGSFSEISRTQTDESGLYSFEGLEENTVFFIEIEYGGLKHTNFIKTESGAKDVFVSDFNLLGEIEGMIKDESGTAISKLPVTLIDPFGETLTNTLTDDDGKYIFSPLNLNGTYVVAFTHENIPYSNRVSLENLKTSELDFTIYGSTNETKDIRISRHQIGISTKEGRFEVIEFLTFRNDGNQIFEGGLIELKLPIKRHDLKSPHLSSNFQEFDDRIVFNLPEPIIPGQEYEMYVEYHVNFDSKEEIFEKETSYSTDSIGFFVEDVGGVRAEPIKGVGPVRSEIINNLNYQVLEGTNVEPNTALSIKLSSLPSAMSKWFNALWIVPLIAIVTLIFIQPLIKYGLKGKNEEDRLKEEKDKLFLKIKKVEEKFKAGDISKNEYERIKSKHKEKIIGLIEEMDNLKDQKKGR